MMSSAQGKPVLSSSVGIFNEERWISDAAARNAESIYAPSSTRKGCQPAKITIASAIQPSPLYEMMEGQPILMLSE